MVRLCRIFALVVVGCMAFLSSGCSKTAPNESNFRASINRILKVHPLCIGFYFAKSFPLTQRNDKFLDLMASKGLLSTMSAPYNQVTYNLTDTGRMTSMRQAVQGFGPATIEDRYFCYSEMKVDKIVNYTEPSNVMGQTLVVVSYIWKPVNGLPSWATDPKVADAVGDVQLQSLQTGDKSKTGERKADATLIQTHNGWRHSTSTDY